MIETDDKILLQQMTHFLLGSSSLCGLDFIVLLCHCSAMMNQSLGKHEELGEIWETAIVG